MATLSKVNSNFNKIATVDTGGNILSLTVPQNITSTNSNFTTSNIGVGNIGNLEVNYLTVTGNSNLGLSSNILIFGGLNGQALLSNGAGGVYWANYVGNIIIDGNSNARVTPNGNINFTVSGNTNVLVVHGSGINVAGNANVTNTLTTQNLNVTNNLNSLGNADLGSNSNVTMRGGEFGWLLTTDGNGQLFWKDPCQIGGGGGGGGSTIAGVNQIIAGNNITVSPALGTGVVTIDANLEIQPQIQFTAPITAFAQTFTNPNIATFQNGTYALVAVNGVIQSPADYTIAGTTLTITNNLNVGDIVQIGPTGGGGAGAGGNGTVTEVTGNGGGLGFTLTGTVNTSGNITLTVPTLVDLRNSLNIANIANISLNGVGNQYLNGAGNWVPLTFESRGYNLVGNVIDVSAASYYNVSITGPTTLNVANVAANTYASSFILDITNGQAYITWGFPVRWSGGVVPVLSSGIQVDTLGFYTYNGGVTWNGFVLGRNMSL